MKRLIFFCMFYAIYSSAFSFKQPYTYRLFSADGGIVKDYVFPNTPNSYAYQIQLSPSFQGSAPGKFKVSLEYGKFADGKTIDEFYPYQNFTVIWDDIPNTNGIVLIKEAIPLDSNCVLKKGSVTQISHKIASLKGQVPNMTLSTTNLSIGSKNSILAELHGNVIYPGIMVSNFPGTSTNLIADLYEWTLPKGWKTSTGLQGTFVLGKDDRNLTIIPDNVNIGEIKVRAMNDFKTAGSEYKAYTIERGFAYTNYPQSITFGDNTPKTFSVTAHSGIIYEWTAPAGWSINGQGNVLEGNGMNSVSITPNFCSPTDGKVQVRLKKDGEVSLPYVFPYSGVTKLSLEIPDTEIYQYEVIAFKNILMSSVQSMYITGDGVTLDNDKILFTKSGNINALLSIMMNGCNVPLNFPLNLSIKPHRLSISGSTTICSQTTYTISNFDKLSPGATVLWSASKGNITFESASGDGNRTAVFNQTGYGDCEVRAAVSLNGVVIANLALPVSICQPSITGPSLMCPNTTSRFTVQNTISNITWSSSGSLTYQSSSLNSAFFKSGTSGYGVVHADLGNGIVLSKYVTISEGSGTLTGLSSINPGSSGVYLGELDCPASGTFSWRLVNRNDVSDVAELTTENPSVTVISRTGGIAGTYAWYRLELTAGGSTYTTNISGSLGQKFLLNWNGPILPPDFNLSPNPASGTVTVSLIESEGDETVTMQGYSAMDSGTSDIFTIQLWNSFGLLKQVQTDQSDYQLDLTGVAPGFYYVHVIKDGQTYRKQLVVQ